jgi:hypothetical protein
MSADPFKPAFTTGAKPDQATQPQPGDEDIVRALVEIEHASHCSSEADPFKQKDQPQNSANVPVLPESSGLAKLLSAVGPRILIVYGIILIVALSAMRLGHLKNGRLSRSTRSSSSKAARSIDAAAQNEIEGLLARIAAGDRAAATDLLERASSWRGKTQRTQSTERSIDIAFNLPDLHQRAAAIEATLALDGIPKSEVGVKTLEAQLPTASGRSWALWMLGALGNRGVDLVHTAKIVGSYIDSPDAGTRAAAVNGLAVLGTDETIPMLLDRFRNDPSPVVQERAACSLAESGMYTHQQRIVAAATLVSWLDDSSLSPQQHTWTIQALGDIAHQHFGNDSLAWRSWLQSARS